MAAANPGAHRADGRECSGKAPLFAKILPRAAGNKKITVVDMVSTTVTDLANNPKTTTNLGRGFKGVHFLRGGSFITKDHWANASHCNSL